MLRKINNERIIPIPQVGGKKLAKGYKLFLDAFCNIFICAKKNSGKTTVLKKTLEECIGKDTQVIIFASTINIDNNWKAIIKWLDDHNIEHADYTSIKEDKVDILQSLLERLQKDEKEEEPPSEINMESSFVFNFPGLDTPSRIQSEEKDEKKKKASKYQAPEYILIFDDLSNELKNPNVTKMLKESRHYKFKVIISSQYLNDLPPGSISQLDYVLLFGGMPDTKLEEIYDKVTLSIEFDEFKKKYKIATEKKYSFLYIDVRNDRFRKNFDHEFIH